MKITPLASALGAQIDGLDIAHPLSDIQRNELLEAWRQHLVLRFRGTPLTPEQLIAFSKNFGQLEQHSNYQAEVVHPEHPEVLMIRATNIRGERIIFGQQWHADLTYTLRPAKGACLHSVVLPPIGGDTLFTNMELAYQTLSPTMKRLIDDLEVIHDLGNGKSHRNKTPEQKAAVRKRNPPVVQPMVRVNPDTGKKALFVSEWMCRRIVGMSEDESESLLSFLFRHCTQPEFQFRQSWNVGDTILWDNRSTLHMALADYPSGVPREMIRTSILGQASGRFLED